MFNDITRNVFKYPSIKTMLGADDDPNQVRTSCTITSCWSILERNVQAWYIEYPVYDMRQIDKNSYTASSCNSLPANYGPGLPAEANYCDICGADQRKNLDYLIWIACFPYVIAASAFICYVFMNTPKHKILAENVTLVWVWGLLTAMLSMSVTVWQNLAKCKNAIKAWFLFVYPTSVNSGTNFSIGIYLYGWGTVSLGILYFCVTIYFVIHVANQIHAKMKLTPN